MHRLIGRTPLFGLGSLSVVALLFAGAAGGGCGGGKKPATTPSDSDGGSDEGGTESAGGGDNADGGAEKKDECIGFDIANLEDMLLKVGCEEKDVKPESINPIDLKGKLEVSVSASPTKSAPGGKVDLQVVFANKSKDPLVLHFRIDPVARFETEVYDKKGKRSDLPTDKTPPPPKGATQPPASEAKSARITIAPNGSARTRVQWDAVKMKWAPEKYRGTPPEKGFPRGPAGPLPKGKYTVKVVTPLVGVSESGVDHEVSAPKVEIEIGG